MKIKGFDEDLKCRGYQFEIGKTYEIKLPDGYEFTEYDLCSDKVFHYCNSLKDVHGYYSVNPSEHNRFCEIEVLGKEVTDGDKCGSNKIKIIREIVGEELNILKGLINGNTGLFNSGNCNSGNYNSGCRNSGNRNSGNYNSGDYNSGHRNSGHYNSGNYNSGYCNSGDCNSGYFNSCDYSSGLFCTQDPKVKIFDIETDMTMKEVIQTDWYRMLFKYSIDLTKWIEYTDEEKQSDKDKDLIGGYLKTYTYKEACKNWWDKYTDEERAVIMSMPNFNKEKFKQITGIEV